MDVVAPNRFKLRNFVEVSTYRYGEVFWREDKKSQ